MPRRIASSMSLALFLSQAGCEPTARVGSGGGMLEVTGELTYLQRIALPPESAAVIELQDVSIADLPAAVVAEERIDLEGRQVPIPFRLTVDRGDLAGNRRYSVRGTIVGPEGRLLWTTTAAHLVDPAAENVALGVLMLSPAAGPQETAGSGGSGEILIARGNEPGWRVDISPMEVVLLADTGQTRLAGPGAVPEVDGDTRTYRTRLDGQPLVVTFVRRLCADSMTGMPHPYTVTVFFEDRELTGCGGNPSELLQGAEWVVGDLDGSAIIDRSRGTLNFGADGTLGGRSFCNTYQGTYALTGESLTIGLTASTLMACEPALMDQETRFTNLLARVQRFEVDPTGALILHTSDPGTITARRE